MFEAQRADLGSKADGLGLVCQWRRLHPVQTSRHKLPQRQCSCPSVVQADHRSVVQAHHLSVVQAHHRPVVHQAHHRSVVQSRHRPVGHFVARPRRPIVPFRRAVARSRRPVVVVSEHSAAWRRSIAALARSGRRCSRACEPGRPKRTHGSLGIPSTRAPRALQLRCRNRIATARLTSSPIAADDPELPRCLEGRTNPVDG